MRPSSRRAFLLWLLSCHPASAAPDCGAESMVRAIESDSNRRNVVFQVEEMCVTCVPGSYVTAFACTADPRFLYLVEFAYAGAGEVTVPSGEAPFTTRYYGALWAKHVSAPFPAGLSLAKVDLGPVLPPPAFPPGLSVPALATGQGDGGVSHSPHRPAINRETGEIYARRNGDPAPMILRDGRTVRADTPPSK